MATPSGGAWLRVPGARLYYEVHGSGPLLALVGHPMGAAGFAPLAALLSGEFTVVAHDPRGFARSAIDDPDQDADPELLADDLRRVIDAVGGGPAEVFASSGGAVTALALATRHAGHVATVVAHEPPLVRLLPDAGDMAVEMLDLYDTFVRHGADAAWERFAAVTGTSMSPGGGSPRRRAPAAVATSERFFRHGLLPIALYDPDLEALSSAPARVVVAGGSSSTGELARRAAAALAGRLRTPLVEFPGGHTGFASDAAAFADVLRRTLSRQRAARRHGGPATEQPV